MYLLSPFQPLLCTIAKLIFLKRGSTVTVLLRTFRWFPFVFRIKSNVSGSPFPVTLCTIFLNLACNLANVSSHYSLGCTFVLAYILCFRWEYLDFLYFKGCLQSPEEMSLLCVGFPYACPLLYCHSIWLPSLTLAFMRLNNACLYAILIAFTFLYSQLHEVKIFISLTLYHLQYLEQCLACNRCSQNVCSVETMKGGRCHCVIKRELNLGVWHLRCSYN